MKIHAVAADSFHALSDPALIPKSAADVPDVLQALVTRIAAIMRADACSLYLLNPETAILTFSATYGLNAQFIDQVHVRVGEGLSGLTIKHMRPISVADADKNPDFRLMPGLGEERVKSFLSVPLVYGGQALGVLVIQHAVPTHYRKKDIQLLMSLAIPAVNVIERARFFSSLEVLADPNASVDEITVEYLKDHHLKGIAAAPGISMAKLRLVGNRQARRRESPISGDGQNEIERLHAAFRAVTVEIQETRIKAEKKFGPDEASIFEAYLLFLESPSFQRQIVTEIETGAAAVRALETVVKKYLDRITQGGDEYIRERTYDIRDIARKIADYLNFGESGDNRRFACTEDTVFFNEAWSIADLVYLDPKHTRGILSALGGAASHVALLAESLGIPAVLGLETGSLQLADGNFVILDGATGEVIVNPSPETVSLYRREMAAAEKLSQHYLKGKSRRVFIMRAGADKFVPIGANIEMAGHAVNALKAGADEIGLFRTEFPFLVRRSLPTEDEQYHLYRQVLRLMKNRPVTFRTLDIGGDKYISYLDLPRETNPALGWRSIRFSLDRRDLFRIQLRALLKASVFGRMRLLFPMICSIEELDEIENIITAVKRETRDENHRIAKRIPVGYMIETPAAVGIADAIAKRADFLSIGTNDLIQYCLAVDRANPKVASLYDPYHPAVLKMIAQTATSGRKAGIPVSVCGDMAAKPLLVPVLWGMGITGFSMNPSAIPRIKDVLRRIDGKKAASLARKVTAMTTGTAVRATLKECFVKYKWGGESR